MKINNGLHFFFVVTLFFMMKTAFSFPRNVPDEAFFLRTIFGDFKNYFYQLRVSSVVRSSSDNCREYEWKTGEQEGHFTSCIQRTVTPDKITEIVIFEEEGKKPFSVMITREGENLKPIPNRDLMVLDFHKSLKGNKTTITMPRYEMLISIQKREKARSFILGIPSEGFQLEILTFYFYTYIN